MNDGLPRNILDRREYLSLDAKVLGLELFVQVDRLLVDEIKNAEVAGVREVLHTALREAGVLGYILDPRRNS